MGKSRTIRGNLNTFLSGIAPIGKLNILKDVSSSQVDINSVCCQANNGSFFVEFDQVIHECVWKKKGLRTQSQNIPDEKQEIRSAFSTDIKIIKLQ